MKFALTSVILLALSACSSPNAEWVKPQASKDETYTQFSECSYQVGLAKVAEPQRELMVAHCMRGKGYRYVAAPVPVR